MNAWLPRLITYVKQLDYACVQQTNIWPELVSTLDFPFKPWELFLVSHLIKLTKLWKHCTIITGIVACDINYKCLSHTLCEIPTWLRILNKAPPSCFPLCALLSFVNPSSALCNSHTVRVFSLIQWPVTAKYLSELLACHASQVTLMTLPMVSL